ncbi:MAG: hypothetical protein HC803_08420, partial [Saprospiraceae bacterium]|nr:hypothetical protein [Saprospiraceae bacterium]
KFLIILTFIGLTTISAIAQNCNCAITLDSTIDFASGTVYNYAPGDTICLGKGWRNHLQLRDWSGSESNPIVFINCGGQG